MRLVDSTFDFESIEYRTIEERTRTGDSRQVRCGDLVLRPARRDDDDWIHDWLRREELYRAFGLLVPPRRQDIEHREFPDGSGEVEPVEFLVIHHAAHGPVALSICYEHAGRGDTGQEVDLGLLAPADVGGVTSMRTIRLLVLTYLFVLCGARSVTWRRRRQVANSDESGGNEGQQVFWHTSETRQTVSRDDFIGVLRRRTQSKRGRDMPEIRTERGPQSRERATTPPKRRGDETDG